MSITDQPQIHQEWWNQCCCRPIGYIICCHQTRKTSRTQILWGWLLLFAIASCVVLGALIYKPDTPYATPADMRAVTKNFHPLFCAGAKISSNKVTFDAYLIQGDLKTDTVDRKFYESKSSFYVDAKNFYFYTFYLLLDSSVMMRHCPNQVLAFYVFQGQDNFDSWKEDNDCITCYLYKRYIFKNCDNFVIEVESEDEYFFVYANDHKIGTWVDVNVFQNRSVYDLSDSAPLCTNVRYCEVAMYDLEQIAIYQVNTYYNLDDHNHLVFTTKCVPRIWSYIIIHGVISILLGAIGTVIIYKCCKDPSQRNTLTGSEDERAPLLNSQLPPSYSAVILNPPKYEDIVKDSDNFLPSYSDVISVGNYRQYNVTRHQRASPNSGSSYESSNINDTGTDQSEQSVMVYTRETNQENLATFHSAVRTRINVSSRTSDNSETTSSISDKDHDASSRTLHIFRSTGSINETDNGETWRRGNFETIEQTSSTDVGSQRGCALDHNCDNMNNGICSSDTHTQDWIDPITIRE